MNNVLCFIHYDITEKGECHFKVYSKIKADVVHFKVDNITDTFDVEQYMNEM